MTGFGLQGGLLVPDFEALSHTGVSQVKEALLFPFFLPFFSLFFLFAWLFGFSKMPH
jgi:hypothetical protein